METLLARTRFIRTTDLLSTSRYQVISINISYNDKRKLQTMTWKYCISLGRKGSLQTRYHGFGSSFYAPFQLVHFQHRSLEDTEILYQENSSRTEQPQTDGQTAVKVILKLLKPFVFQGQDWEELLPSLEFAYNDTTVIYRSDTLLPELRASSNRRYSTRAKKARPIR